MKRVIAGISKKRIFVIIIVSMLFLLWVGDVIWGYAKYLIPNHRTHFADYYGFQKAENPCWNIDEFPDDAYDIKYYVGYKNGSQIKCVGFSVKEEKYSEISDKICFYVNMQGDDTENEELYEDNNLENMALSNGLSSVSKVFVDNEMWSDLNVERFWRESNKFIFLVLRDDARKRYIVVDYRNKSEEIISP